jgi:hypothetical protein
MFHLVLMIDDDCLNPTRFPPRPPPTFCLALNLTSFLLSLMELQREQLWATVDLACSSGMSSHAFATVSLVPCHIGLGNDQTRNRAGTGMD